MNQNTPLPVAVVSSAAYDRVENPIAAAETLGLWIAKSGMFGAERPEQGHILALQCIVEKMPPLELTKHFHIIGGKLAMRSDAMLAGYRQRGGKVKWLQYDDKAAKAQWLYDGNDITLSYSIEDAKAAGLFPGKAGSGWAKNPADMLRARLISKAIRMLAPEVCTGHYTPEEVEDFNSAPRSPLPEKRAEVVTETFGGTGAELVVVPELPTEQEDKRIKVAAILMAESLLNEGVAFLRHRKWIGETDDLSNGALAEVRADKILAKPSEFISAVKSFATQR